MLGKKEFVCLKIERIQLKSRLAVSVAWTDVVTDSRGKQCYSSSPYKSQVGEPKEWVTGTTCNSTACYTEAGSKKWGAVQWELDDSGD